MDAESTRDMLMEEQKLIEVGARAYLDVETRPTVRVKLRDFIVLFIKSESLASFIYGYILLLAVLGVFRLPWVGVLLSFFIESVAAGYYLRIMQEEIHGDAHKHLAIWPRLNLSDLMRLFKLGLFTNLVQVVYALFALSLSLPLYCLVLLAVNSPGAAAATEPSYLSLFLSSACFTMPFSFWVIIVMAPVGLARFAHSGDLRQAFDFAAIYRSIIWGSSLIKRSAGIYFAAIMANVGMMSLSPALMNVLEPLIEFSAMALVCRFNARWYRDVIQAASDLESQSVSQPDLLLANDSGPSQAEIDESKVP